MKKIFPVIIFIIVVLLIALFFVLKSKREIQSSKIIQEGMIYFYGQTCPHCANVEKFFEENEIEKKIKLEKKEVYYNKDNAAKLLSIAKEKCNFKENEIGVPFFWDGQKCIIGDEPIINYFKEKLNI